MPQTNKEKQLELIERRAEKGLTRRGYWADEAGHKRIKKIEGVVLGKFKKASLKKKKAKT